MTRVAEVAVASLCVYFMLAAVSLGIIKIPEHWAGPIWLTLMDAFHTLGQTAMLATVVESLSKLAVAYWALREEKRNSVENAVISYYTKAEKTMEEHEERTKKMDITREEMSTRMLELIKLEIDKRKGAAESLDAKTESVAGSVASSKEEIFCTSKAGNTGPCSETPSEISVADTKR